MKVDQKDISSRKDIDFLLATFYSRVREHEILGPIFNEKITNWKEHLIKIGDFWETTLMDTRNYHGNPMRKHLELDKSLGNKIEQEHFGFWLELWFSTVDTHFKGDKAFLAKERARNMAHIMFIRIFQQRSNP